MTSVPEDPSPLVPDYVGNQGKEMADRCSAVIAAGPGATESPYWKHSIDGSPHDGAIQVCGESRRSAVQ